MSPQPPIDTDSMLSSQNLKDGLVSSVLGGLAMVARLLLSTEPVTFGWVVRRVLAASITACFVGYAIQDHIASTPLRMAVIGACGYSAPEVLDFVLRYIKKRGEKEINDATPTTKPTPKRRTKSKGKSSR